MTVRSSWIRRLTGGLGVAAGAVGAAAPGAAGQAGASGCTVTPGEQCTTLTVPLDRSGSVPGTVTLSVTRTPAASGHRTGAFVALAGGPGQAAIPLVKHFTQIFAPALTTRDLIVFDQRGIGQSSPISCPGLDQINSLVSLATESEACAASLGAARPFYTTRDSVDDLEAVRRWSGVDKITLFGGSYGTKLALAYATRFPQHVEMLILDSTVPLDASAFNQDTFGAVPRVLTDMCAGACAGITKNPVADVAALARRLHQKPLRGKVRLPTGRSVPATLADTTLFNLLSVTDVDPFLRAEFPGVVRSTLNGDAAPILRMLRQTARAITSITPPGFSTAANFATLCEDTEFPWKRSDPVSSRPAEGVAAALALPASSFFPFAPTVALSIPPISQCLFWPQAPNPPQIVAGPLPHVPALLLEGADDLRTTFEGAQRMAAQIPGSTLVEVPDTGHDTLDNDPHGCATGAFARFVAGQPASTCPTTTKAIPPFPLAPRSFNAVPGAGRGHKTVTAAGETATDVERSALYDAVSAGALSAQVSDVGLRGGSFSGQFTGQLHLKRVVYVPGEVVSGTLDEVHGVAHLTISGRAAVHRRLTLMKRAMGRAGAASLASSPGLERYRKLAQARRYAIR